MQMFLDEEEAVLKKMVDQVAASGANVVFCQKGVDDLVQHFLADEAWGKALAKGLVDAAGRASLGAWQSDAAGWSQARGGA